jgi:hypothetical protein
MDAASIFIALISIVFAVASVVVRMSEEEIYFDKEYKYAIRRANEELPAEALSPIEAVITEVVEYELQTLRGNIEETVEQQVDSDVHPTTDKDSPVADVLNEYDSTDISLTDAVDDDGISSFSSVDTPEDIPEVIQSEIAEPIDALEELHDIVERQPTVQRRESRLLLGSIVFGIIALVVTIVRFLCGHRCRCCGPDLRRCWHYCLSQQAYITKTGTSVLKTDSTRLSGRTTSELVMRRSVKRHSQTPAVPHERRNPRASLRNVIHSGHGDSRIETVPPPSVSEHHTAA